MSNTLVIVESPAKARTIKKYLGTDFEVLASGGHVKDLPKKLGVDVNNDFAETYEVIEGKAKLLGKLKAAAKKADKVLLATDPDREGEAIAFHIAEELHTTAPVERVEFNEITRRGVEQGVQSPRTLDVHLYDAQRARRVLDRIVGYDVSALVWKQLAFGLSAGRVQSVALRLIVDREREIEAFVPVEYWNLAVGLRTAAGAPFAAKVTGADGEKLEIHDRATADAVRADLESAAYRMAKLGRREERRNPPAPYITSKLQQDAANILHMPAKRTMRIAQQLYEGVDLERSSGPVGLVTYIRTDSTRVAVDAVREVREHIAQTYGVEALPAEPNVFRSKKNAQDAHEAIRPTDIHLHPESVRRYLKSEQYRVYKLIYERFVASQMLPAVYDRTTAEMDAEPSRADELHASYRLRASGRVLKSPGWLQAMEQSNGLADEPEGDNGGPKSEETSDERAERADGSGWTEGDAQAVTDASRLLPEIAEDEALSLALPPGVMAEQKFTQPPPRYNEGSLVRELERRGIGRPSTYAEIISKVQARAYVEKLAGGGFQPTELGKFVVDGLVGSELDFMDPGFTAQMEEDLDEVGAGKLGRVALLTRFYKRFTRQLERSKKLPAWKPTPVETDEKCEECGSVLLRRWSKNGWFLGCSAYPKCKYTRDASGSNGGSSVRETDIRCDKCGKPMVIRNGRYGEFLSCSGYPQCKSARPVPLGVACPKCGGDIIEIRPRKKGGRTFYGCSNYNADQKCDFKLWSKPVPMPCPRCGAPFLTLSRGRKPAYVCLEDGCGYRGELPEDDASRLSVPPPPTSSAGGPISVLPPA